MNLLKRWRKHENGGGSAGGTTALSRRGEHGFDDVFSRMRGELDRTFDRLWKDPWSALDDSFGLPSTLNTFNAWPAVDVSEDDHAVTLRVDVPGLDEKDLDVEASGNLLTIRGSREEEHADGKHRRRERLTGSFVRTVTLPSYVDASALEARYDKGVLTITAPKQPGKGPRRVKVSS
jgi:HSP20 family protein